MAETTLDETTLSTLSLLESRMLRIEHLLHGQTTSPAPASNDSASRRLNQMERRFATLISDFRIYGELLKIYKANPDLFHAPSPSQPPSELSPEALQAIVLSSASAFPATLSSLTAVKDCPIPDPSESAALIALTDRMKGIEATQVAQAAEMAELRKRSEILVHKWYQQMVLQRSESMAELESRVERIERGLRRKERQVEQQKTEV